MGEKSKKLQYDNYKYLGEGHSGKVYLMPNGKVLKIFKNPDTCKDEYNIYKRVEGCPHFPKAYECSKNHLIREYVGGTNLSDYIKTHGLDRDIAIKLINLLETFKKLGFKKCDLRFPHIFIQKNGSLMVIDPRKSFTKERSIPSCFLSNLEKSGFLPKFIKILKEERSDLYNLWIKKK